MKKLKFLVGAVVLFAIVVVNVWNAATTLRGSELSVADVEAIANPEDVVILGYTGNTGRVWEDRGTRILYSECHYEGNVRVMTTCFESKVECVANTYGAAHCNPGDIGISQSRHTQRSVNTGPGMWDCESCTEMHDPGNDGCIITSDKWGKTGW